MLTEICQYLKNWFNRKPNGDYYPKYSGKVVITEGDLVFASGFDLVDGQYIRIMGSLFNDGVHKVGDTLVDEVFEGAVSSSCSVRSFLSSAKSRMVSRGMSTAMANIMMVKYMEVS